MQSLAAVVRHEFDSGVRTRGEVYYRRGAVRITQGDAWSAAAQVKGSQRYVVSLRVVDHELIVDCSCPYFADVGPCKHVWAVVLAADANGHAQPAGNCRSLIVTPVDDIDNEDVLDNGADDDEDGESCGEAGRRLPQRSNIIRLHDRRQVHAALPPWKRLVTGLREALRREQQAEETNWPAGGETVYVVDMAATMQGQGLVVEVLCRQFKLDGSLGVPKPRAIGRSQVAGLPDAADRHIAALLFGAAAKGGYGTYYYGYEPKSSTFVLTQAVQDALVPLLCRTGRCLFRVRAGAEPKLLQLDDGPPWEFRLEVRPSPDGRDYVVRGALWRGDAREDLSEPVMLVAGGWVFWAEHVARLRWSWPPATRWKRPSLRSCG